MARTTLTVQNIDRVGLTPALAAANADGSSFANDGRTYLQVKNGSGAPITVTVQTPGTVDGLAVADLTVTVPATTGDKKIGPFPVGVYNQAGDVVYVDFSAVTTVTVGAFKV